MIGQCVLMFAYIVEAQISANIDNRNTKLSQKMHENQTAESLKKNQE